MARATVKFACLMVFLSMVSVCAAKDIDGAVPTHIDIAIGSWPPFLSTDLQHNGPTAHLIQDLFEANGIQVTFTGLPWGRAYRETALAKHDATGVWMHKAEREADFLYSDPVLTEKFVFFHRKDVPFDWASLDDLTDLRITGGIQYSYGDEFDQALSAKKLTLIHRLPTKTQNINMILSKRADIWPEELNVATYILQQSFPPEEAEQITFHPLPFLNNNSYLLFPKAHKGAAPLRDLFNLSLAAFRENGRYDAYLNDYRQGKYALPAPLEK